ncbi:hypothetical protein GGR58DRAFT_461123 [Xylaria digitata]|nr:hypothetical protein GGR58DRAFT_461123 [Xylaria digitata]
MHFFALASIAISLPFLVASAPVNEPSNLVVLEQFLSQDGVSTITVYGDAVSKEAPIDGLTGAYSKRCGSNTLVCDNSHLADRNACTNLINDLRVSSASLLNSLRSICATYGGSRCCVSWHNPVSNAIRNNLVSAAQKALDGCRGDTGVSGKTMDTMIGSTCTNQCLSNRPDGC